MFCRRERDNTNHPQKLFILMGLPIITDLEGSPAILKTTIEPLQTSTSLIGIFSNFAV
jgi:hypothetical protein